MTKKRITYGNPCFLVYDESLKDLKHDLIDYLEKEGFKRTMDKCNNRKFLYINVNSMLWSYGAWGANLTNTIVNECYNPYNGFSIEEFKIIWDILKKHKTSESKNK